PTAEGVISTKDRSHAPRGNALPSRSAALNTPRCGARRNFVIESDMTRVAVGNNASSSSTVRSSAAERLGSPFPRGGSSGKSTLRRGERRVVGSFLGGLGSGGCLGAPDAMSIHADACQVASGEV